MSDKISHDLKYDIFYFVINKDVAFFDENKTGAILSRLSEDTQIIQMCLGTSISMVLRAMITIVVSIIILAVISWRLTLVLLAGIIPVIVIGFTIGKLMRKMTIKIQAQKA
jgi:ABC-type bacteriocin/lantibiotic exporter with double-glycine peptidase domain